MFTKLKKRIVSALLFFIMKAKKNIQSMCQKRLLKDRLIYY